MKDGEVKPRNRIVIYKETKQYINPRHEMLLEEGWLPYVEPEVSAEEEERINLEAEVEELKNKLSSTDYKVIKCMEAMMVGGEMPYDMAELHAERQRLRDRVNEIEDSLSSM